MQIGGEEDHLRKGDILYNINGEELAYKNKFELVSKLSSLEGIAEVSVLRKINPTNCFGSTNPELQVPYHNGIFAQNSIKLAMRKYEKPSMKSNSEADFATAISTGAVLMPPTATPAPKLPSGNNIPESGTNPNNNNNTQEVASNNLVASSSNRDSNVGIEEGVMDLVADQSCESLAEAGVGAATRTDHQQDEETKLEDAQNDEDKEAVAAIEGFKDKGNFFIYFLNNYLINFLILMFGNYFKEENAASKQTSLCCASGSIMTSFHSDNWLFYDKRPTVLTTTSNNNNTVNFSSLPLPEMLDSVVVINNPEIATNTNNQVAKVKVSGMPSDMMTMMLIMDDNNMPMLTSQNVKQQQQPLLLLSPHRILGCAHAMTAPAPPPTSVATSVDGLQTTTAYAANGGAIGGAMSAFDLDEGTARSLTSSSCHSERSVIHLNCVVCFEDDSSPNLGLFSSTAAVPPSNNNDDVSNFFQMTTSRQCSPDNNTKSIAANNRIPFNNNGKN